MQLKPKAVMAAAICSYSAGRGNARTGALSPSLVSGLRRPMDQLNDMRISRFGTGTALRGQRSTPTGNSSARTTPSRGVTTSPLGPGCLEETDPRATNRCGECNFWGRSNARCIRDDLSTDCRNTGNGYFCNSSANFGRRHCGYRRWRGLARFAAVQA
jgi:hypothetical protein